ncbi:MAG: collagen-like protein [Caldilineaceae bacterium SB0665_bin_25]|nr:collagen-like protein [Caldilineaceae bacterium SB0665_bin_25]
MPATRTQIWDENDKIKSHTTTERDALFVSDGHMVYNSEDDEMQGYNGSTSSWVDLTLPDGLCPEVPATAVAAHTHEDYAASDHEHTLTADDLPDHTHDGIKGDKGDKGDQGDPGPKGDKGDPGPQGIQGEAGPPGADGPAGEDGEDGERGEQGIQGIPGPQGEPGSPGTPGRDGRDGEQGIRGPQGIQGPQGERGTSLEIWTSGNLTGGVLDISGSQTSSGGKRHSVTHNLGRTPHLLGVELVLTGTQSRNGYAAGTVLDVAGEFESRYRRDQGGTHINEPWVISVENKTTTTADIVIGGAVVRLPNGQFADIFERKEGSGPTTSYWRVRIKFIG